MKHGKHGKKTSKRSAPTRIIPILLGVTILAALVVVGLRLLPGLGGLKYEANAFIGSADNSAERLAEMQAMVDRSMITMSINASPVWLLSDEEAGVNWQIENPAEQSTKLIRVEVIREDTGDIIYQTGALRPGTYITGTKPDVALGEGIYPCTAYFYSYDIDTEDFLGKAGAQITLYVQQ